MSTAEIQIVKTALMIDDVLIEMMKCFSLQTAAIQKLAAHKQLDAQSFDDLGSSHEKIRSSIEELMGYMKSMVNGLENG